MTRLTTTLRLRLASTTAPRVLRTYVLLTLLSTFAASFIWGINTLFLLDAGLTITQAFAANAFFTAGQVLFEIPTGVVADTFGRRISYVLGAATLFASTLLYWWMWSIHGPFWAWALVSVLLGLGFTFFSGATEAWLVDALHATKYRGTLEAAFARGQIAGGIAMLTGALAGGVIAQATNLGVPYIARAILLALTFVVACTSMQDIGFSPKKRERVVAAVKRILRSSLDYGFRNPPARWLMLSGLFAGGVGIYAFYAMQPYLLQLYGEGGSYSIAGLAAAIVAGTQILGGALVPRLSRLFRRRTTFLLCGTLVSAAALAAIGLSSSFGVVLALLGVWALVFAAAMPVRQAFLNGIIPSEQRATVLSTDNLLASSGGVAFQPALGRVADVWGYAISYVAAGAIELFALPLLSLARREKAASDPISRGKPGRLPPAV
jgi:MFS family permease